MERVSSHGRLKWRHYVLSDGKHISKGGDRIPVRTNNIHKSDVPRDRMKMMMMMMKTCVEKCVI